MEMSKAKAENRPLPKRFYAAASVQQNADGFTITLDEKTIRTPQQKLLHTKNEELARHVAAEWEAQQEFIDTDTMPLTRLLNIALDRIAIDRDALLKDITGYGETDLLCYRTPDEPSPLPIPSRASELRALQAQHFDPILAWLKQEYAMTFVVTDGLIPVPQAAPSLQKLFEIFAAANDHELAALALMVPILGSALLALAVWKKFITVDEALVAAHLDEAVQQEQWGEAPEASIKWDAKCRDVKAAAFFLNVAH